MSGKNLGNCMGLFTTGVIEGNVAHTLDSPNPVPLGFTVTNKEKASHESPESKVCHWLDRGRTQALNEGLEGL
jgi:hypothetical protein